MAPKPRGPGPLRDLEAAELHGDLGLIAAPDLMCGPEY